MKFVFSCILFSLGIGLSGCDATGQSFSKEQSEDTALANMLQRVANNQKQSLEAHKKASEKEQQIVTKTVEKIVDLKEEVKDLKNELNEVKTNLVVDTNRKFKLFPISHN